MINLQDIKAAIEHLTADELGDFRAWFAEYGAAQWDEQFADDVAHCRLDAIAQEAMEDFREGRCTEL
jgi:hypothetical protein